MFSSINPKLCSELHLTIFNFLPKNVVYNCRTVSKAWGTILEDNSLINWKQSGATSFQHFANSLRFMPVMLKRSVLGSDMTIQEANAEHLKIIFSQYPINKRIDAYLNECPPAWLLDHWANHVYSQNTEDSSPPKLFKLPDYVKESSLSSDNGIKALVEGLITIEQAMMLYKCSSTLLSIILSDNGLIALRENLITPEQLSKLRYPNYCSRDLLSDEVITTLRTGLITADVLMEIPDNIRFLCSEYGRIALRERRITPQQAKTMSRSELIDILDSVKNEKEIQFHSEQDRLSKISI